MAGFWHPLTTGVAIDAFTEADTEAELVIAAAAGGHIVLTGNIALTAHLVLGVAGTVLDLNGYTISATAGLDLDALAADPGMLYVTADQVTIRNGTVDGDLATSTNGIKIFDSSHCTVEWITAINHHRVAPSNQTGLGIVIYGASHYNTIRDCVARDIDYSCFDCAQDDFHGGTISPEHNQFVRCFAFNATAFDGFDMYRTVGTRLIGCFAEGCTGAGAGGLRITGGSSGLPTMDMLVLGCYFRGNTRGIFIQNESHRVVIADSHIMNNVGEGILTDTAATLAQSVIHGNVIKGNGGSGISLVTAATDVTVRGNQLVTNTGAGIFTDADRTVITGNTVRHNTQHGIYLSSASRCDILGNTSDSNGTATNATYDNIHLASSSSTNQIRGNRCWVGTNANKPRYGVNITSGCNDNVLADNDLRSGGVTADSSIAGTGTIYGVASVVAGTNVTVDATDPANPVVAVAIAEADVRDAGRWEVVVDGTPAEAVTNTAGDDWLYVWVGA